MIKANEQFDKNNIPVQKAAEDHVKECEEELKKIQKALDALDSQNSHQQKNGSTDVGPVKNRLQKKSPGGLDLDKLLSNVIKPEHPVGVRKLMGIESSEEDVTRCKIFPYCIYTQQKVSFWDVFC